MAVLRAFPIFVVLVLIAAGLMLVPSIHAASVGNWLSARVFLYHSIFLTVLGVILGLATMNRQPRHVARYLLLSLLMTYVLLPIVLAAPLVVIVPTLGWGGAYFEMLSSFTTTGATLFDRPRIVGASVHLWRAIVGWSGGFLILVVAFSILAPLNLGGFEIGLDQTGRLHDRQGGTIEDARRRILRFARLILPVYAAMTAALALMLVFAGDTPLIAVSHAMAVLSTSGISPVGGLSGAQSGWVGELALALFLLPAVTHRGMRIEFKRERWPRFGDPQVQLMLISVLGVTCLLFLRSFIGATEIDRQDNLLQAARAIWGSLFTILSFLTTLGFESRDWLTMQLWSDLPAPGTILLGVAVMGGGIATTAGGVKLLRLYALYLHGLREMDILIHPSSLGRRGKGDRLISERGARVAFVFLMLFLLALAFVMIALSATGLTFEQSLALAVAGLTTTGPAISALGDGLTYAELQPAARAVLCLAMIVGRMEALVIIALFNPTYWRQ